MDNARRARAWYDGWVAVRHGGPGSGNWGHAGRKGQRGGSLPRASAMSIATGRYAEANQAMARGETLVFDDPKEAIGWLQSQGYEIAHGSTREIIDAQWKGYYQSDLMEKGVQYEMSQLKSGIMRSIPRDLVAQWSKEDISTVRDKVDQWTRDELERRRSEIEAGIKERFYRNWEQKYGDDVIIRDKDELSALTAGIADAHVKGDISPDATFILRNPATEKEQWQSGKHADGVITLFNTRNVGLGIMDRQGRYIKQRGFYRQKSIDEPIHNTAELYTSVTAGTATHEYGHHVATRTPAIEDRAAEVFRAHGGDVRHVLSEYANTNEKEAAAEAYGLSRHPDFERLPKETQRVVNYILTGERTP